MHGSAKLWLHPWVLLLLLLQLPVQFKAEAAGTRHMVVSLQEPTEVPLLTTEGISYVDRQSHTCARVLDSIVGPRCQAVGAVAAAAGVTGNVIPQKALQLAGICVPTHK